MIRHLSLFILFLATLLQAGAQAAGTWEIMPVYGSHAQTLIDTGSKVYTLGSGNLYVYDTRTDEMRHYNKLNGLNDLDISRIAYNYAKGYLVIVYNSCNIDLLYDNGRVVNIPDIRDANISASKAINSIDFADGRIYLATGFGFVAIDDATHRVADSGIYGRNFNYAGQIRDHIVLVSANTMYVSDVHKRHNSFESFEKVGYLSYMDNELHAFGDSFLLVLSSKGKLGVLDMRGALGTGKWTDVADGQTLLSAFTLTPEGDMYVATDSGVRRFSAEDGSWTTETLPAFFSGKTLTVNNGLQGDIWTSDSEGVGQCSVDGGEITVLRSPSRPESLTCAWPAFMFLSPDGRRLYITSTGFETFRGDNSVPNFLNVYQSTNIIEDGSIRDVTCYDIDGKGTQLRGSTEHLAEDPNDPSRYFIVDFMKGVYVLSSEDGSLIDLIGLDKLPYSFDWAPYSRHVSFDRYGNLWISQRNADNFSWITLYILPKAKLADLSALKPSDWVTPDVGSYTQGDGSTLLHHSRSNCVLLSSDHACRGILVYDHKGDPTNLGIAERQVFSSVVDQDGINIDLKFVHIIKEDKEGRIWIGTASGIFYVPDLSTAIRNGELHVRRPKVPRNDGTNYADYLTDGQSVLDIAADPSDRKWLATSASGVYLVSADGTEIIQNFTTDNSPMPSNRVLSIAADPFSNAVYIGTDKGVVRYSSDAAAAAQDYSDVYAYPNPVRPDYTGWITVTGLMDNSLVKITDTAGNVVNQGRSEGGMYSWDGCNLSGRRVRSGVYFVFASQNVGDSASGKPVTKIMVIN